MTPPPIPVRWLGLDAQSTLAFFPGLDVFCVFLFHFDLKRLVLLCFLAGFPCLLAGLLALLASLVALVALLAVLVLPALLALFLLSCGLACIIYQVYFLL